ncbi:MAG: OmpA family protein [Alphaproteobacteria bacterium]
MPEPKTIGEVAAKPPITGTKTPSLSFAAGTVELSDEVKTQLGKVTAELKKNGDLRLQLYAYASEADGDASKARRVSLFRAYAVRSYLMSQGVEGNRLDIAAYGNKAEDDGPADRVDPYLVRK